MLTPQTVIIVLSILFMTTLLRSSLGFGDALVAMPLLSLLIGIEMAVPLVGLLGSTISFVIFFNNRQQVQFRTAARLIVASFVGIPIGVLVLRTVPEAVVLAILGVVLVAYGLYGLIQPRLPMVGEWTAYPFGFVAGVLGGAYNTNGPPIVIYGTLRRWEPQPFRVTLQTYFVPTGSMILISHALGGLWTRDVLLLYVLVLPLAAVAIWLGGQVNRHLPRQTFRRIIYLFLVVIGVVMVV
jgi:hypothetical protein